MSAATYPLATISFMPSLSPSPALAIGGGNIRQRSRSGVRHGGGSRGSRRRDGAIVARLAGASDCEHMSVPLFLRWTAFSVFSGAMPTSSRSRSCCTEGEVDGVAREAGPCTSTSPTQSQLESQTLQSQQKLWENEISESCSLQVIALLTGASGIMYPPMQPSRYPVQLKKPPDPAQNTQIPSCPG